jgi:hypothetical protein
MAALAYCVLFVSIQWDFLTGIGNTKRCDVAGDLSGISRDKLYAPAPKARKQLGVVLCGRLPG